MAKKSWNQKGFTNELNKILKEKSDSIRQAAADALNQTCDQLVSEIKTNMAAAGIESRHGKLIGSIKFKKATAKNPRTYIKSEVYAERPKEPNKNRRLWGKDDITYPQDGVPYGRILEFSPRYNRSFFYKTWYERRETTAKEIIDRITDAWVK